MYMIGIGICRWGCPPHQHRFFDGNGRHFLSAADHLLGHYSLHMLQHRQTLTIHHQPATDEVDQSRLKGLRSRQHTFQG